MKMTSIHRSYLYVLALTCGGWMASTQAQNSESDQTSPPTESQNPKTVPASDNDSQLEDGLYARLKTNKGEILLNLEFEKTPLTVINFSGLAEGKLKTGTRAGQPYYDGLTFHRVIADFMIQGGCPDGNGSGGPGYRFRDEIHPELRHSGPGILSMANAGPGTNGSQFFITHKSTDWLDGKHTVFGKVVTGMDVVNQIANGDTIEKVTIERIGEKAQAFRNDQEAFDELVDLSKSNMRLGKEFLNGNKSNEGVVETASGLQYRIESLGNGPKPSGSSKVRVHYEGKLLNGTVFDSSYKRNTPAEFPLNRVIAGWTEGLQLLPEGSIATLWIPSDLAYGNRDIGNGLIPGGSTLIFKVELLKIID
ncbi:MAG: peptidylprolyl isomerase [Verrucomicrobia bacterium]|nr:peptidylprolyl isomerase [Verrucomicrobiota bacterium]